MNTERYSIPYLSVHPSQINTYARLEPGSKYVRNNVSSLKNLRHNKHAGYLSPSAEKKITRSSDYLLFLAKPKKVRLPDADKYFRFRVGFITLTLSSKQIHSDNEIKSLFLNHFLVAARKKWGMKRYVWKAEKQKSGVIHFHILTDKFIPWYELRSMWNNIQEKLGYVSRYREAQKDFHSSGFKFRKELSKYWSYSAQKKAYKEGYKNNWSNPNSVDVHAVKFFRGMRTYIRKYLSKNDKELAIEGRIWGCSYDISSPTGARDNIDSIYSRELGILSRYSKVKIIEGDYFTTFYVTDYDFLKIWCPHIWELFSSYIKQFAPG